jgi:hypothetical protein
MQRGDDAESRHSITPNHLVSADLLLVAKPNTREFAETTRSSIGSAR